MTGRVWRALAINGLMLFSVGLLAIGASGLIAAGMSATVGPEFVAGDLPGNTYTSERCADLMEYAPTANSCAQAAAIHHTDEVVLSRIAAGVLGLIAFAVWWLLRRRSTPGDLPAGLVSGAGVSMFGVVGLAMAGLALNALVLGGNGAGAPLSAVIVSLIVALVFGIRLVRELQSWSASSEPDKAE